MMEELAKKPGVDLVLPKGMDPGHELADKLSELHMTKSLQP